MKQPDYTFRADKSTGEEVHRIADGLIDAALHRARHPGRDAVEDVHFFRTTAKRLRALLQLIRPMIAMTTFDRENERLKRAADRLAPFRDRAVAAETVKAFGKAAGLLWELHRADRKPTAKGSRRNAMRQAARDLELSRIGFQQLRFHGENWDLVGPGLMRVYKQARRRMKEARTHPGDRAFHRWRIRVKQLFHQLRWLEPVWPRRFRKLSRRLHKLEEMLGADHDLVVLCALLEKTPGRLEEIAQVKKSAAKQSRRLRRASERLGGKTLNETPRRFRRSCERHWQAWRKG